MFDLSFFSQGAGIVLLFFITGVIIAEFLGTITKR